MFQDLKMDGGGEVRRDRWNRLVERLETVVPNPGPGMLMRRTPSGTTLWPAKKHGRGGSGGGRFTVTFKGGTQTLHVGEGSVAWALATQPDSITRPYIPKLDGTPLTQNPGWNIAGKESGVEYEVVCIYHSTAGRMVLHDPEDELEIEDTERARLIATVTFQDDGGEKSIGELVQRWQDDIEDEGGEYLSSSFSGSEDDDSDSEGGGGDSGSDDESDDSSGSSISSSSGCSCPGVTIENAVTMVVGAEATLPPEDWYSTAVGFANAIDSENVLIVVETKVEPPVGNCDTYRGRLWLTVEVGLVSKKSVFLGQAMGGSFVTEHVLSGTACEVKNITACVSSFGNSPSSGLPALGPCCAEPYDITLPPVLGEGPCPEP